MKKIFWNRVGDVRKLGSFAIVCLAIVIWVGARACVALFQEAIFHSFQEWLLAWNWPQRTRLVRARDRVVLKAAPVMRE